MGVSKKSTGKFGENEATKYLINKNYEIIAQNYYGTHGELDIIALDLKNDTLVFAEVKTRSGKQFGLAAESIGKTKLKSLVRTARQFLLENPYEYQIRFDVVEVYYKNDSDGNPVTAEINHIENAFFDLSGL